MQFGLALHKYHDSHKTLPPGRLVTGVSGNGLELTVEKNQAEVLVSID